MDRNEYMVYVPKELIINEQTSGLDILLYINTVIYGRTLFKDPICLSYYTFADKIYGRPNQHIKEIKESLTRLEKMFPDNIKSTTVPGVVKIDFSYKYSQPRVAESLKSVDIIINSKYNYKLSLLKYYFLILASIKSDIYVGTSKYFATDYGVNWFANYIGVTKKTISLYTSCLEKLELIYVLRDSYNKQNNIMGRYQDSDLINIYGKMQSYGDNQIQDSNYKRSLMAKFNYLSKQVAAGKPSPYSRKEVAEIRKYITEHNKYCKAESKVDATCLEKIKDLSIIDNIKY